MNIVPMKLRHAALLAAFCALAGAPLWAQTPNESLAAAALIAAPVEAPPVTEAAPETPQEPATDQLKLELDALRDLLGGVLPQNAPLRSLFEIDLADEAAVTQRIDTLRTRLAAADANVAGLETIPEALAMRAERDRLRLAFLSLPAERRNALREQDRLKRDTQALAAEQEASAAALAATEQARDSALAVANSATDEAERVLATEQARLLAHSSELAALRQSWAMGNQAQLDQRRELLERYAAVDAGVVLNPTDADALYTDIRNDLKLLRTEAGRALDALTKASVVVPLQQPLDLDKVEFAAQAHAKMIAELRQLRVQISLDEIELQARESEERYADAEEVMEALRTLQARRIALLPMLSKARRQEVTGFTSEGFARVVSEIAHVRLMARWYPLQRLHQVKSFAALLRNVFNAGRFGMELTGFLIALGVLILVRRRVQGWLRQWRAWLSARVQPRTLMLRVDGLLQMLIAIAQELILLLSVYILFDQLLSNTHDSAELHALRKLAYAYAYYTLSLAFIHRVLLTAVSRYRAVSPSLNFKILKSLRLVARLGLFVSAYLIIAKALLGRGALYGIAQDVAVLGAILVGWRLIRDWREEVTSAYLKYAPNGRLAALVRASKGRSFGLLIATAAFLYVAARGLWTWLRDVALGFEQTRKALAYLFRRQLERQSKNLPPPPDPSLLPAELQEALTEGPPPSETLSIDHYPRMNEVLELATSLAAGRSAGALIALTGERGAGKTTWLQALQRHLGDTLPNTLHTFETRIPSEDDICRQLAAVLGVPETTDPQRLIADVLAQPPQVVLLDLAQNIMLRAVGGLAGYQLFLRVAQATVGRVLWVVAYAHWPFQYLQRVHSGRDVYDDCIELQPWSEEDIGALIDARLDAAGFTADYDQLLLNTPALAARPSPGAMANEAAERTADRYYRLIWDYADGNPRVALHFFRLSLAWNTGKKVTVRLFPMPVGQALEDTATQTRFVLSCLVQHENITAAEAAESLCFPFADCAFALELLRRQGFLEKEDGERYRVTSHWNRAVQRFLHRKKLLVV